MSEQPETRCLIVRLKRGHSVLATLRLTDTRVVILDVVEAREGPCPDCSDLIGAPFPRVEYAIRAIRSRMRSGSDARSTLDSILLSAEAVRAWELVAVDAGAAMAADGIDPRTIPDEISENPDGSLLIYVEVGGHRAELLVPPHHWQWSRRDRPA